MYILQSETSGKFYIGSTNDLSRRLNDHNRGKTTSTQNKGPWAMLYFETFPHRVEAVRREMQVKSYKGGEAFKKIININ